MKVIKNFSTLLCAVLCTCGSVYAQTPWVYGNLRVDTLLLTYRNWSDTSGSLKEPKIILCNLGLSKSFAFSLPDPKAAYTVELTAPGVKTKLRFLAVPGEQAVVTEWNRDLSDTPTQIDGSGFYVRWKALRGKMEPLVAELNKLVFQPTVAQERKDSLSNVVRETALTYIKEHASDPVAVMALHYLRGEDLEKGFNLLDQRVREGALGPYAFDMIDRQNQEKKRQQMLKEEREKNKALEVPQQKVAEKIYASAKKKQLEVGDPIPRLVFTDVNGKEFTLDALKGKYIYIDVWTTWCGPCRREIPSLKKLEEALTGKDIVFVSISTDNDRRAWEEMVKKDSLSGVQLYAGGGRTVFASFFGVTSIPRFILLDKKGDILNLDMSRPSNPETEKALRALKGI